MLLQASACRAALGHFFSTGRLDDLCRALVVRPVVVLPVVVAPVFCDPTPLLWQSRMLLCPQVRHLLLTEEELEEYDSDPEGHVYEESIARESDSVMNE